MQILTFRITARQRGKLLIGAPTATAAAGVLGVAAAATNSGSAQPLWEYAVGIGLAALISWRGFVAYAFAFTECTPAGIRTRGLGRRHECRWPQVRDIGPQNYGMNSTVIVTTTSGERFRLGAPVDGSVVRDPDVADHEADSASASAPHRAGELRQSHCP